MIANKKLFSMGIVAMGLFIAVLVIIFSPVFNGQNGLEYMDDLYNSISKGSAYYIPRATAEAENFTGHNITVSFNMGSAQEAEQARSLFEKSGADVEVRENKLKVEGDLGKILENCIEDSELMYRNDGKRISEKYGYNEKQVIYNWWVAFREIDKDLKKQQKYGEAKTVDLIKEKAVETSYNYYKIEPQKISERLWVVIFSLIFYVLYTLWYGFSIMYLFEGWGFQLDKH